VGDGAIAEGEPPGMRYTGVGRPAFDNVRGLEKLRNLFLVERLVVSSQCLAGNTERNDARENNKKG
jgi:hypothetical protein